MLEVRGILEVRLYDAAGQVTVGDEQLVKDWTYNQQTRLWVDILYDPNNPQQAKDFLATMGCHELAISDALRPRHPPKIEYFEREIFIVYRGIHRTGELLEFEHQQIAFFIGERYLITLHTANSLGIDSIKKSGRDVAAIPCPLRLACEIMHASAAVYIEKILQFEPVLEEMEDAITHAGTDELLANLTTKRTQLIRLSRVFNYHVSITEQLRSPPTDESSLHIEQATHNINDLHDRFERLASLTRMYYDIAGDLINGYLSIASHNLNNTMRVLTVITAIFVPLGFLAGLYGMNFEYIPELKFRYAYFVLLSAMGLLAIGLITFFKKKRWF